MSFSLIGIVTVQVYWINNAVEAKKRQFKSDVKKSLARVSEQVSENEYADFYRTIKPYLDTTTIANSTQLHNFVLQQIDTTGKQVFSLSLTTVSQDIEIPTEFLANDSLDLVVKRIATREDITKFNPMSIKSDFAEKQNSQNFTTIKRSLEAERAFIKPVFDMYRSSFPIHQRLSNRSLNLLLREEFSKREIDIDFKYGVYSVDGYLTSLKSGYFTINKESSTGYPLFKKDNGESEFKLFVTFPNQKKHILADISNILLLSVFFIFIIIVAFSSSLYQLIRQKKISEIKTDFINNMTHEFKTPIATINLALDSIKNPKIIDDKQKVLRYLGMIKEENKRMHAQVENVLRISKLEKNELNISKERLKLNDIAQDAINHVELIVEARNGEISTNFDASKSTVLANETHFTNVIVNILENAIKYTPENKPLKINVSSHLAGRFILLDIKDQGAGMSKIVQKKVFEKFYREHTGNVHNVKGHGLGLSYVKQIVEDHEGHVTVISEKGIGSTFTIKLPLIS